MKSGKHTDALVDMVNHPDKIGLIDVIDARIEVPYYHNDTLVTELDILFELKNGIYVPVEYKCSNGYRDKAKVQLLQAEMAVYEWYGKSCPVLMYVHDNPYVVEVMTHVGNECNFRKKVIR